MPPKSTQVQKTKGISRRDNQEPPPTASSTQKTDIKGFFQHSQTQDQQESSIVTKLSFASPVRDIESRPNGSPLGNMQLPMANRERSKVNSTWNMQAYMQPICIQAGNFIQN